MSQYTIFGCGSIGNAIVCSLNQGGSRIFVVDKDKNALQSIESADVQVMVGDMQSLDLGISQIIDASAIAILTGDLQVNLSTLKRIKKEFPDKFVLLVSDNINDSKELYENGANIVVHSDKIVSNAAVLELQNAELKRSAFMLGNVIKSVNKKGLAILLQDNPDPDAIASGLALKAICKSLTSKA